MNASSSRSHCLFCVHLKTQHADTDVLKVSKLYIVDLAGSERLSKSCTDSQTFLEGSNINLSLHFLEQVIVALNEKSKGYREHIPYRNSILTTVLRDSLGGNCRTAMIANISSRAEYVAESITTCRFAQRVGMVQNASRVNEEIDVVHTVNSLKRRVFALEEEISILRGIAHEPELTSEQLELLKLRVMDFLSASGTSSDELICGSAKRVGDLSILCIFSVGSGSIFDA